MSKEINWQTILGSLSQLVAEHGKSIKALEEKESKNIELNETIDEHYIAIKKKLKTINNKVGVLESKNESLTLAIFRILNSLVIPEGGGQPYTNLEIESIRKGVEGKR